VLELVDPDRQDFRESLLNHEFHVDVADKDSVKAVVSKTIARASRL
jgi:hypothetical protein